MLFDNNSISIDGPTSLAVSDNFKKRFESYSWDYIEIDGHNEKQIFKALKKVQKAKKPTVISCKTKIGYGSPNKSGTASAHGNPLGEDEIKLVRKKLKWAHKPFAIPKDILREWKNIGNKGSKEEEKWKKHFNKKKNILNKIFSNKFENIFQLEKKNVIKNLKPIATRKSSEQILTTLVEKNLNIIGGSADLAGSNNTKTKNHKIIKPSDFKGNYIHYGVREHAMCGIMNGLALHSGLIPYGGTFLIFSDYCKPSIRLSAVMKQRVIYVMTHDSIGLGEDGPTHQPIEQLSGLRSIPNLNIFRPADTTETYECWQLALENLNTPSVLALTRQKLNPIRREFLKENKCSFGAYEISRSNQDVKVTIIATGSEVNLALEVSHKLATENIYSKVISVPCQELFKQQSDDYKNKILNETEFTITIEAGSTTCWQKYIINKGLNFGIEDFGKSAPYKKIYDYFGLTAENISKKTKEMINK
jgi:transketolase